MKSRLWRAAVSACLLALVTTVSNASVYNFTFTGVFTVLDSSGDFLVNADATTNSWSGNRTDVAGTFAFDDVAGSGTVTVDPFNFFGGGPVIFTSGATQAIGDGIGNPGNLMIGGFIYNWNGNNGLNMDLVWDVSGLFDALNMGMTAGDVISGDQVVIGGNSFPIASALPASNSVMAGPSSFPIGPTPMATTTFDLTGGALPLITDLSGIAGSPQTTGPYLGFSASLDIGDANSMHLVSVTASAVPVPATVWLFGSGLLGLAGMARRRKA